MKTKKAKKNSSSKYQISGINISFSQQVHHRSRNHCNRKHLTRQKEQNDGLNTEGIEKKWIGGGDWGNWETQDNMKHGAKYKSANAEVNYERELNRRMLTPTFWSSAIAVAGRSRLNQCDSVPFNDDMLNKCQPGPPPRMTFRTVSIFLGGYLH